MLNQFRSRYPQGSLVTELLCIDHGLYVVRCWVQAEGTTLATGLAAAQSVELAEDRARSRALTLLGIEMTTATNLEKTASHPRETTMPSERLPNHAPALSPEDSKQTPNTQLSDTAKANVAPSISPVELNAFDTSLDDDHSSLVADQTIFTDELSDAEFQSNQKAQSPMMSSQPVSKSLPQEELVDLESNGDLNQDLIEKPSQDTPIDFSDIIARTNVEMKRLGWGNQQGRDYLLQTYGKRSRQLLTDQELLDFLRNLESMPTPE
ncbi:MAG: hypothetical protein F6K58_21085 [Symploca sp. SIO2E9]|nr:hypothetical protein [Symploca sp. SIO2E9]